MAFQSTALANRSSGRDEQSSVLSLRKESPFRPPNWRWARAQLYRDNRRMAMLLPRTPDQSLRTVISYQTMRDQCEDDYDRLRLFRRYPSLYEAQEVYESDRAVTWELEARLLANDTVEHISSRLHISPEAIDCYEKMFFNVRDRLTDKGYVAHVIIGDLMHAGLTERQHDVLWKFYGYCGGPIVLDAVIDKSMGVVRPENEGDMPAYAADDVQRAILVKSMVAARTMPVNSYTQGIILELHQRYIELKQKAGSGSSDGDSLAASFRAVMENIPWTVGDEITLISSRDPTNIVGRLPPPLIEADKQAMELRAIELTDINLGTITEVPASRRDAKFPVKSEAAP